MFTITLKFLSKQFRQLVCISQIIKQWNLNQIQNVCSNMNYKSCSDHFDHFQIFCMNIYNLFRMAWPNTPSKKQYMYILANTFSLSKKTFSKTYNFTNQYFQTILSDIFASRYCLANISGFKVLSDLLLTIHILVLLIQQSIIILGYGTNQYFLFKYKIFRKQTIP